jgi:hypothetical protein
MEVEVLWHGDYCNLIKEYYTQNGIGCNKDYVQFVKPVGAVVSHNSVVCLVSTRNSMELVSVDKKGNIKIINKKNINCIYDSFFVNIESICEGFRNIELGLRDYNCSFKSKELFNLIENSKKSILSNFYDRENIENINELIENVIKITKADYDKNLI